MTRDDDPIRGAIKAAVSLVMSRVAEKNTQRGTQCKLMRGCGSEVRVACTTKDPKVVVCRQDPVKGEVRCNEP